MQPHHSLHLHHHWYSQMWTEDRRDVTVMKTVHKVRITAFGVCIACILTIYLYMCACGVFAHTHCHCIYVIELVVFSSAYDTIICS